MKENFINKTKADEVIKKASELAKVNFDTADLQKEYYENKADIINNPNNEKEEMEGEKPKDILYIKNAESGEKIKEILASLEDNKGGKSSNN